LNEADAHNLIAMLTAGDRSQGELNAAVSRLIELALQQDVAVARRVEELEARVRQLEKPGIQVRLRRPPEPQSLLVPPKQVELPDVYVEQKKIRRGKQPRP
jgi:hypothetical protein